MDRPHQAVIVFAGDEPGSWWLVHTTAPRFAGRVLTSEEFESEPGYGAVRPHGIDVDMPIHFTLGADVLVVTDFIDPIQVSETASPQTAILTPALIDALHACRRAIERLARRDPAFAPLAAQAEQFLVGWRVVDGADAFELRHASGARVKVTGADGTDPQAEILELPTRADGYGWAPELLHERLGRVARQRARLRTADGWETMRNDHGHTLTLTQLYRLLREKPDSLHWIGEADASVASTEPGRYVALQVGADGSQPPQLFRCEVEIDAASPLLRAPQSLTVPDIEALRALLPAWGLEGAVSLVAAHRFGWFEDDAPAAAAMLPAATHAPLPHYPCEVELRIDGQLLAAVAFAPADAQGRHRLAIAPHAPAAGEHVDPSIPLPFECVHVDRRHFHLPAYLAGH